MGRRQTYRTDKVPLRKNARSGIKRNAVTIAGGVGGASVIALLALASVAPLLLGGFTLGTVVTWLSGLGANALATWLDQWAQQHLQRFDGNDPDAERLLLEKLARDISARPDLTAELAVVVTKLDAITIATDSLANDHNRQEQLLKTLLEELQRLQVEGDQHLEAVSQALRQKVDFVHASVRLQLRTSTEEIKAHISKEVASLRASAGSQGKDDNPTGMSKADLEQAIPVYLTRLQAELAQTDVVPIANAYAAADTRDYVPLQVDSPPNAAPEPVFAALAVPGTSQRPAGLLLIGDAGSGKSHTLRYAALLLAQAWPGIAPELQADLGLVIDKPLLPVYVQLQDLPRCRAELRQAEPTAEPTLLQLIDHHLCRPASDTDRWPAGLIRMLVTTAAQPCLFLLDGLDEIDGSQERRDFQEALLRLQREHQEYVYVVTSRPLPDLSLGTPNFVVRNLLPLQPEQMRHILLHWYRTEYGAAPLAPEVERQVEQQAGDLLSTILKDQDLGPMAPNPLLLTAMARMAISSVGLPRLKVRKYGQMVDLLLEWRRNRIRLDDRASLFADLRHRAALGHLARFAACMLTLKQCDLAIEAFVHGACVQALPPPGDEDSLDVDAVEQLLRSVARHTGLLVEHGGRYCFTFGFGAYLAACAHARFDDVVERLFKHHADPAWRATIIMTVGYMMDESAYRPRKLKPLFTELLSSGPQATLLAAEALCETIDRQPVDEPGHYVSELAREGREVLARLRAMNADPALIRRLEPFEEDGDDIRT